MKRLKEDLAQGSPPTSSFIHVRIPLVEAHLNHIIDKGCCFGRQIHPKVRDKIHEMVGLGITSVAFVKRALKQYVLKDLCPNDQQRPFEEDQAYFPSNTTIQSHIHIALVAGRYSALDQENLERKIAQWVEEGQGNHFFFRKCTTGEDGQSNQFLFVHQNQKQARLLQRYGDMVLLDATYKTSKYSLPLFFLVVRTNVGYKPVVEFICETETTRSITEALELLKRWNPEWRPRYFMTDYRLGYHRLMLKRGLKPPYFP